MKSLKDLMSEIENSEDKSEQVNEAVAGAVDAMGAIAQVDKLTKQLKGYKKGDIKLMSERGTGKNVRKVLKLSLELQKLLNDLHIEVIRSK